MPSGLSRFWRRNLRRSRLAVWLALDFVPGALKTEEICRTAVRADRKALRFTPLSMVDEIASEWPAGWDPAVELAWGAWRSAAIEGRITREQAEKHGVDQFLPRGKDGADGKE